MTIKKSIVALMVACFLTVSAGPAFANPWKLVMEMHGLKLKKKNQGGMNIYGVRVPLPGGRVVWACKDLATAEEVYNCVMRNPDISDFLGQKQNKQTSVAEAFEEKFKGGLLN